MIGADGDNALADRLLIACGMDPVTGETSGDSMFAAANAAEIAAHMAAHGSPYSPAELARILDATFIAGAETPWPICDLDELMATLKADGYRLGIASSDGESGIRRTVEVLRLERHIDFIAGYDSGHGPKPEPGMVLAFARHLGISPSEISMVGDNRHDLAMARAAGAGAAIGVLSGTGTLERSGRPGECLHCHSGGSARSPEALTSLETRLWRLSSVAVRQKIGQPVRIHLGHR
jgi:phosphoglycolate phosphatase